MTDEAILKHFGWRLLSMPGETLEVKKDATEEDAECYADGEAARIVVACLRTRWAIEKSR